MQKQHIVQELLNKGYSFFNTECRTKGMKTSWKKYQTNKPTFGDMQRFTNHSIQNYAIVCGEISDLMVVDVDTKNGADPTPFLNKGFYEVRTPSGGYHFYFKYEESIKKSWHAGKDQEGFLKGIDLQTNGTVVYCPPSDFGKIGTYTVVNDAPIEHIPEVLLLDILAEIKPEEETPREYTPYTPVKIPEMGRPGDIFNAIATWEDVLYPLGWKKFGRSGGGIQYWTRPGKSFGVSASTNYADSDLLFPFTNQTDLDAEKGYTKFNAYATLIHDGDYKKAAKALVMENYKIANNLI